MQAEIIERALQRPAADATLALTSPRENALCLQVQQDVFRCLRVQGELQVCFRDIAQSARIDAPFIVKEKIAVALSMFTLRIRWKYEGLL